MVPASSNSAHADSPADHMSGHRGRMRAKLLDKGSEALSELELLEMLLYAGNRRGDTKPLAKALMRASARFRQCSGHRPRFLPSKAAWAMPRSRP